MAGIHGKNAVLRVSTTETILSGTELTGTNGGSFQAASGSRDWRYDKDEILIQFTANAVQGAAADVNDISHLTDNVDLNVQTRLINYAGGAVHLGQHPAVHSGVFAMAPSMELTTIANLVGDNRNYTVTMASDTVESTVIGDSWKSFEDGLAGFEGTLDGLWIDSFWYKRAVATLSGLIPRTVLKIAQDPKDATTFYQGTVIFPSFEFTGAFDNVIEYTVGFQGRGPLDLVEGGTPFFKVHQTS